MKKVTSAPDFGIRSVTIANIGTIDYLEVDLTDRSLLAICAGNGIGKTTLLEAISLIGHLPCFPTLERGSTEICPSLLRRKFKDGAGENYPWYDGIVDTKELKKLGLTEWFKKIRPSGDGSYGTVEFTVFDKRGSSNVEYKFGVLIHSHRMEPPETPRLTDILSRDEFDQDSEDDVQFTDDRYLDSCGLIVFDKTGDDPRVLIEQIAYGRKFRIAYVGDPNSKLVEIGGVDLPLAEEEGRAVTYVNTDLNDFGRGNDLRESPKDLERDFGAEMINRLRLEFDAKGEFVHIEALRRICREVLDTPGSQYESGNAIRSRFHLECIRRTEFGAKVKINRLDGRKSIDANFLSAGENEVLFVFLLILNASHNRRWGKSIILLDEPDLHISNPARISFFSQVLDQVSGKCQLILCTHSSALHRVLRRKRIDASKCFKVLYRVAVDYDHKKIMMRADYDRVFIAAIASLENSSNPLAHITSIINNRIRTERAKTRTAIAVAGVTRHNIATLLANILVYSVCLFGAFIPALMVGSTLNDQVFPDDTRAFAYHNVVEKSFVPSILALSAAILFIVFLRLNLSKKNRELNERIESMSPPMGS